MISKPFRADVVLSVVTGFMACRSFSDVHECIEHMAGGPVWTHQIPVWHAEHDAELRRLFPDLADYDVSGLSRETADQWLAERAEFLAHMREVPVIGGRPSSPFEGLPAGKDVVVVATGSLELQP